MKMYGEISYLILLLNILVSLPGMDGSQVLILLELETDQIVYALFSSKHFFTFKIITKMNGQNKKEKKKIESDAISFLLNLFQCFTPFFFFFLSNLVCL